MPKLKAKREGTLVYLPVGSRAAELMLEFLRGDTVGLNPCGVWASPEGDEFNMVAIHVHVDILDGLVVYINANI